MMFDGFESVADIYVDAGDPSILYVSEYSSLLESVDSGRTWNMVPPPAQDVEFIRMEVDPVRSGRIYGFNYRDDSLLISEDEGRSWREVRMDGYPSMVVVHPTAPDHIYSGHLSVWDAEGSRPSVLWHSSDGGSTWQSHPLDRAFQNICPDPREPNSLYGIADNEIWHSADKGKTWRNVGPETRKDLVGVATHPAQPDLVYAWGNNLLWHSPDGGQSWENVELSGNIDAVILHPQDPQRAFVRLWNRTGTSMVQIWNRGEIRIPVTIRETDRPVGTLAFTPVGQQLIASVGTDEEGAPIPGIFTSLDGGQSWSWYPGIALFDRRAYYDMIYVDPVRPDIAIVHLVHGFGTYLRSGDGGRTWNRIRTGGYGYTTGGVIRLYPGVIVDPNQEGTYFLSSLREVSRSTDFRRDLGGVQHREPARFQPHRWTGPRP